MTPDTIGPSYTRGSCEYTIRSTCTGWLYARMYLESSNAHGLYKCTKKLTFIGRHE